MEKIIDVEPRRNKYTRLAVVITSLELLIDFDTIF